MNIFISFNEGITEKKLRALSSGFLMNSEYKKKEGSDLHCKLCTFLTFERVLDDFCLDNLKSELNNFIFLIEKLKLFSLETCAIGLAQ